MFSLRQADCSKPLMPDDPLSDGSILIRKEAFAHCSRLDHEKRQRLPTVLYLEVLEV